MRFATVTCLVHATDDRATVRLCVTRRRPVPVLTHGCGLRGPGAPPLTPVRRGKSQIDTRVRSNAWTMGATLMQALDQTFMPNVRSQSSLCFDWIGFAALSMGIGALQLMLDRGQD